MTTETKPAFTPGEWWCNGIPVVHSAHGEIAVMSSRKALEAIANADLISAAPDLLAVLERAIAPYHGREITDADWAWVLPARKAIAKAYGRDSV